MTITRFSTGAIRDNALATNTSFAASDMELIGTVRVGSSSVSSITFSNIPQEYKHLQIRTIGRCTHTGVADAMVRLNNDSSTSNYVAYHYLYGNGTVAGSGAATTGVVGGMLIDSYVTGTGNLANAFNAAVIDILDYSSISKYKTGRSLNGYEINGSGVIALFSSLWMSTAAINQVSLLFNGGHSFSQYSRVSLYGIRG